MNKIFKKHLCYLFWVCPLIVFSQEFLSKENAVKITLENNLDVKITENTSEIAKINTSVLNSGYLPTIGITGSSTLNVTNSENIFSDGRVTNLTAAETRRENIGLNIRYTLFDGFGRMYNYKKLKTQRGLTDLQSKELISQAILQLFTTYHQVAMLSENVNNQKNTLAISKKRYLRARYLFEYGQNTGLDLLNSEVDVNTDSIALLNIEQDLRNAKRDLNIVMNRPLDSHYEIDTTVVFLEKKIVEQIYKQAVQTNLTIQQLEKQESVSDLEYKSAKSVLLPNLEVVGSYNINQNKNNAASFLASSSANGFVATANLTWNLFEGRGITAIKGAKLSLENQKLNSTKIKNDVIKTIENSWETYLNSLAIYKAQKKNVETNKNNFSRTTERYKLSQITNIEFRQAQENLNQSIKAKNQTKYSAKLAEITLLYIAGRLINTP